ncbi:zinc finger, CCHC-type containing protein, partial [Tanacetum coccineum]
EEEKDVVNNRAIIESTVEPSKSEEEESPKKAFVTNKFERRADDKPTKSEREKVTKNKAEEAAGASRIAKDVLVDVAGYVYPMDFVILDIKEDEKRLFILGTPFLTTAKAVIKFDKGTITLRSEKSKISFYSILESLLEWKEKDKTSPGKGVEVRPIEEQKLHK